MTWSEVRAFTIILILAFIMGVLVGHNIKGVEVVEPVLQEVLTVPVPVPVKPEVRHILESNPKLSDLEAIELYATIEKVVHKFKADPSYKQGVTHLINPRLILSLIITESSCRRMAKSHCGAIGLTQVMPLHVKGLHRAGILDEPVVRELWNAEKNISAGVYILMGYAKTSKSINEALGKFFAGPTRARLGMGYATKVLKRYSLIKG